MKTLLKNIIGMAIFAIVTTLNNNTYAGSKAFGNIKELESALNGGFREGKHNLVFVPCQRSDSGMCHSKYQFKLFSDAARWYNGVPATEEEGRKMGHPATKIRELMSYCGGWYAVWEERVAEIPDAPIPRARVIAQPVQSQATAVAAVGGNTYNIKDSNNTKSTSWHVNLLNGLRVSLGGGRGGCAPQQRNFRPSPQGCREFAQQQRQGRTIIRIHNDNENWNENNNYLDAPRSQVRNSGSRSSGRSGVGYPSGSGRIVGTFVYPSR